MCAPGHHQGGHQQGIRVDVRTCGEGRDQVKYTDMQFRARAKFIGVC